MVHLDRVVEYFSIRIVKEAQEAIDDLKSKPPKVSKAEKMIRKIVMEDRMGYVLEAEHLRNLSKNEAKGIEMTLEMVRGKIIQQARLAYVDIEKKEYAKAIIVLEAIKREASAIFQGDYAAEKAA